MGTKPKKKKALASAISASPKPGNELIIALPDAHFPYQDELAMEVALKVVETLRPAGVIVLGDWADAGAFSQHPPKNLAQTVAMDFNETEIKPINKTLDRLQKWSDFLVYIEGNHEAMIERAAARLGRIFNSIHSLVSPKSLISEDRENFTWIPYNHPLSHYSITPNFWAIHGWSHAQNAAAAHLNLARSISIIHGHTHRSQMTTARDPVSGNVIKATSPGCLSKLQPLYQMQTPTNWTHGISLIYRKVDLSEWVEYSLQINNGETILPNGKSIKA